ncbi:MAG: cupin domain-containing protein [Verrucomicrobiota bacterium]
MNSETLLKRRFVTDAEKIEIQSTWTLNEWLCHSDIVNNEHMMLVRATMEAGHGHPFHTHPTREEIIYIISGQAEQWVGTLKQVLGPGQMAFIPMGEVHGTYNPFSEKLVFLAILSPVHAEEPDTLDVSASEPWCSLRNTAK